MPCLFTWTVQIRLDQSLSTIGKRDQTHTRILNRRIALKAIRLPLDSPHHPLGLWIVQYKPNAIDGMRRPVDQSLSDLSVYH